MTNPDTSREAVDRLAEREEAYARGYHDCQKKGITEGRLVIEDSPELVLLQAERDVLKAKLEVASGALRKLDRRNDSLGTFSAAVHEIVTAAITTITADTPKEGS